MNPKTHPARYRRNFGFVGASATVLDRHTPEEKTRVQSLNDFINSA